MKWLPLAFGTAVCFGLLGLSIAQEAPRGRIRGRLVMKENNLALPKAMVSLESVNPVAADDAESKDTDSEPADANLSTTTDKDGNFSLPTVPVGLYKISFSGRNHNAKPVTLMVDAGEVKEFKLSLDPAAPQLSTYFSQEDWLPGEKPAFEMTGFIPQNTVSVKVYKVSENDLIQAGNADSMFNNYRSGKAPAFSGEPVRTMDYKPVNRDVEGSFVDRVPLADLPTGSYFVSSSAGDLHATGYINITDVALLARSDYSQTLCYAANLKTGVPLAAVPVFAVINQQKKLMGNTDQNGQLVIPAALSSDVKRSLYTISDGALAICSDGTAQSPSHGTLAFVTDRPVYRPGDDIQFRGIARLLKGANYSLPPAGTKVDIAVQDVDGNDINSISTVLSNHGTFHGDWAGSTEMKPGAYSFHVTTAGLDQTFTVVIASYRKPEFTVKIVPAKERYSLGDSAQAKVKCEYYYGAPVVGAKVTVSVFRNVYWDAGSDDEDDQSGDEQTNSGGEFVKDIKATTDESGEATISLPLTPQLGRDVSANDGADENEQDYTYTLNAYAADSSGKGFEGSGSLLATQGDFSLDVNSGAGFGKVGATVDVTASASTFAPNSHPMANQKVDLAMTLETYDDKGKMTETPLGAASVTTGADGNGKTQVQLTKAGTIRVEAVSRDDAGRTVKAATSIECIGAESTFGSESGNTTIQVKLDKKTYTVGDTVKVLLQGPADGQVLLCVDGDTILTHQLVEIKDGTATVDIPVTEAMAPDCYLNAVMVNSKTLYSGNARVNLDYSKGDLKVELTSDNAKYAPGGLAHLHLKTVDGKGQPVQAEVSLGVVDESIYAIRKDPFNIRKEFYPKRTDGVQLSYSFEAIYLDGGDKSPANIPVRTVFKDTAQWNPTVETGLDGTAQVDVTLPENLTQWRATAVAITDQTDVGQTTAAFNTWKPLMVRLDAPNYMINGDSQQVVVGVTNQTDQDQDIKVTLKAENVKMDGAAEVTQHIAAGKQADLKWNVTATASGPSRMVAYAQGATANDAMDHKFTVYPRGEMEVQNQAGEISASTTDVFTVKPTTDRGFGDLQIQVSPSLAGSMIQSLDGLIDYPYGCVEQTLHRFLPALTAAKLVQDLNLPKPKRLDEVPKIAHQSLDRLAVMQHADGSWGWWTYDDGDLTMTSLVLDGLLKAKAMGYESKQIKTDDAVKWLAGQVNPAPVEGQTEAPKPTNPPASWSPRVKATVAAVLVKYGHNDEAKMLMDGLNPAREDPEALALSVPAYKGLGDAAHVNQCLDLLHQRVVTEHGLVHWQGGDWSDVDGITGLVFSNLAENNPRDPILPSVVSYMMARRKAGGWSDTWATSDVLNGMDAYIRANKETLGAGQMNVVLNGKSLATMAVGGTTGSNSIDIKVPLYQLTAGDNKLEFQHTGSGTSYYSATLRQYGAAASVTPINGEMNITVTRSYRLLRPNRTAAGTMEMIPSADSVSTAQSGDVIVCQLDIVNPTERQFVYIDDPTPSNCHVTQETTLDDGDQWSFWYSGMQILDDRVGLFSVNLPKGKQTITYFMRAETPGFAHALPTQVSLMYSPADLSAYKESPMEVR